MTDPLMFDSASPRFGLPLLYAEQAQKEVFVNEAFVLTDALLHCSIEGETGTPPPAPTQGETWLVAAGATGDWEGREGALACFSANSWTFIQPRDGLRVFDVSTGQENLFFGFWRKASAPLEPQGGTTVDVEARAAIGLLIDALRVVGAFPTE
ncbi:DUF2793 domain-containing protein [Novosphingobium malaysiense]|uniref:DUF2793 domain-containing protein n=1 Tax=Novosphingobium malaysiense TaxID=1348853 RepID=A0A0B1ZMK8_9SPHN|nr:DUF2793 domain-containing protein [Novosphingobium malaysiense]KHK92370.1 hypothetical protein LK12_06030 [Novosphingobium malaysiense]